MSVEAMAQVWKLDLPRDQKLVLMAFADHANDQGYTHPSLARVAWKCGYQQTRSVAQIVQKMVDSGVLVLIEQAHGRTPTQYRIMWERGPQLPEFDPIAFKTDRDRRGAENAPQDSYPQDKSLSDNGSPASHNARDAENAPLARSGAENAPLPKPVGVRSATVGVRFDARRGAVATAPEPLTIPEPKTRARARGGGAPARGRPEDGRPDVDRELLVLNNSARLLGLQPKTVSESIEDFRKRVDEAHARKLKRQLEQRQQTAAGTDGGGAT